MSIPESGPEKVDLWEVESDDELQACSYCGVVFLAQVLVGVHCCPVCKSEWDDA